MKRPLEERLCDPIPPVDEDVVSHLLERGLLPISKMPHNCIIRYRDGHHDAALIVSKMERYWLREAHLEFPELVEQYPWAHARAVYSIRRP